MINITERAQDYFRHLIDQQDADDLGLRLQVMDPGTPRAGCDLQFCPESQRDASDTVLPFEGFELAVAQPSVAWLNEAEIDFEDADAGGQLTIKAPNIKGHAPGEDAPLFDRVAWVLESEVNPQLASHGGRVGLVAINDEHEAVLQFGGGCHGCGMADMTLNQGIEKTLLGQFPELKGVRDVTDHSTGENPYFTGEG